MRLHLALLDPSDREIGFQAEWVEVSDRKFGGERVVVDNHQFGRCSFACCNLIYSGGPFGFFECEIDGESILSLTGPAWRAAKLLKTVADIQLPYKPPSVG
jgi:hypothetical protein